MVLRYALAMNSVRKMLGVVELRSFAVAALLLDSLEFGVGSCKRTAALENSSSS